jgi:CRP-like cAMP-binding protein
MVPKRFDRGMLLFSRSEVPEGLHLVREGSALLYLFGLNGRRLLLDILTPGDPIGETFAFDGQPASVSVEARTTLVTGLVPTHRLSRLVTEYPQIREALAHAAAANFREVLSLLEEQVLLSLPQRMAHRLARMCRTQGDAKVVHLAVTQAELSLMLGASRQAVNKALGELEQRGGVERGFQTIRCRSDVLMTGLKFN